MWSTEIKLFLKKMGKLALNLLQRNSHVFFEEDLRKCELNFLEATVFSGMCTELPPACPRGQRRFCYVHVTLQVKQHPYQTRSLIAPGFGSAAPVSGMTWRLLPSRSSWLPCTSSCCFARSRRTFWSLDRSTLSHPRLKPSRPWPCSKVRWSEPSAPHRDTLTCSCASCAACFLHTATTSCSGGSFSPRMQQHRSVGWTR